MLQAYGRSKHQTGKIFLALDVVKSAKSFQQFLRGLATGTTGPFLIQDPNLIKGKVNSA